MNKNVLIVLGILVIGGGAVWASLSNCNCTEDAQLLENVEALSNGEGEGLTNTGPGKIIKCAGSSGHKKLCMCENNHPCTESECE